MTRKPKPPKKGPPQHITVEFGPDERDARVLSLCADRKWAREVHVYRLVPPRAKRGGRGDE